MSLTLNLTKTPSQIFSKRLVRIKYIQHIQNDLKNCEVIKLEMKLAYLSQAYVIHLVAYWQTFLEDLVKFAYAALAENAGSSILNQLAKARVDDALKRFNTPNSENIDKLFKETLNINKVTDSWKWEGMSRDQAITVVNGLLKMRHKIAHSGHTDNLPTYDENFEMMEHVFRIAGLTEGFVTSQLPKA